MRTGSAAWLFLLFSIPEDIYFLNCVLKKSYKMNLILCRSVKDFKSFTDHNKINLPSG